MLLSEGISWPISRNERSIQIKIVQKILAVYRQKKNLDGFYEVLAPGAWLDNQSNHQCHKGAKKSEVCVHDSDIGKFGTKHEYDMDLGQYIDRRPKKIHEKTLEQKIDNHKKDLLRLNLGSKRIKRSRTQPDDIDVISSGRSCISTSYNVARALKMKILKRSPQHDEEFQNQPDLTHNFFAAPLTQPPTTGPSAPQLMPVLRKKKRSIQVNDMSDSDTSSVRRSKRQLKKQRKTSDQQTQSSIQDIQDTHGYSTELPVSDATFFV